eukprot:1157213-Pelagomonas_calceolata.AAC.4
MMYALASLGWRNPGVWEKAASGSLAHWCWDLVGRMSPSQACIVTVHIDEELPQMFLEVVLTGPGTGDAHVDVKVKCEGGSTRSDWPSCSLAFNSCLAHTSSLALVVQVHPTYLHA